MEIKGLKTKSTIIAGLLFILFSLLYIYTAAPSVYVGDSGELAAGVKNLEVVHPTGFPLYLITAHIFAKILSFTDYAFRLNVYSALLTASTLVLIFLTLRNFNISYLASTFSVLILGLGKTIWFHSGTIGVYPLSLLFVGILLFIFSRWFVTKQPGIILWYALILGISFGTHILMTTMFVPLVYMLWTNFYKNGGNQAIVKTIFLFCIPFIQYLYLYVARGRQKTITTFKIFNLIDLFNYLRQKEYIHKIGTRTLETTNAFIGKTIFLFAHEFTIIFFILTIIGLFYLYKKRRGLAIVFFISVAINISIMFLYGNANDLSILFRYYFIAYALLAIPIAYFLDYIFAKIKGVDMKVFIFIVLIGALLFEFYSSYEQNDRREGFVVLDLAKNIMLTAQPNSLVLTVGDSITGPLWYLQSINIRPDVKIIDLNLLNDNSYIVNWSKKEPDIISSDLIDLKGPDQLKLRLLALLNKNIDRHEIYIISNPSDKDVTKDFQFLPVGVINQVFRKGGVTIGQLKELNSANWQKYTLRGVQSNFYNDPFLDQLTKVYSIMLSNLGVVYLNYGLVDDAKLTFEKSASIDSQNIVAQNGLETLKQR